MPVAAVCGMKGGAGASSLAVNLALALCGREAVLLMDAHPVSGCCDLFLGLNAGRGWEVLLPAAGEFDREQLAKVAVRHTSGVIFLAAPAVLPDVQDGLVHLIERLGTLTDWLLLDLPWDAALNMPALFQRVDACLLVLTCDPPALRNARRWLAALPSPLPRLFLVVNQAISGMPVTPAKLAAALEVELLGSLPQDRTAAGRQLHEGLPMISTAGGRYSLQMMRIASRLRAELASSAVQPRRRRRITDGR